MTELDFLLEVLELKDEKRTGWELRGVEEPESVAAHSWGTAFLAFLFADEAGVERDRAVRMAVVHDLAEAETGDHVYWFEEDKREISDDEKEEVENSVMEKFSRNLDQSGLLELWNDYRSRQTGEARFVKDMDMIDMCLQALFYEDNKRYDPQEDKKEFQGYENLDSFFATTEARLKTDTGRKLFDEIKERYEEAKE